MGQIFNLPVKAGRLKTCPTNDIHYDNSPSALQASAASEILPP